MPWKVVRRDGQYCVQKISDGTIVACHGQDQAKALRQVAALYANEPKAEATMLYMTNQHPKALGQWAVADFETGEISEIYASDDRFGRERAQAMLASAYDWEALTAAGDEAPGWEADPAVAFEGVPTSDRRQIDADALTWRAFPMPFMVNLQTSQQHQGAVIAGAVDAVERRDGGHIYASGRFDSGLGGQEAQRLVAEDIMRGVSLDMAGGQVDIEVLSVDDASGMPSDWLEHFVAAEMSGLTQTPFPAFADAKIRIQGASVAASVTTALYATTNTTNVTTTLTTTVAAGGPVEPPVEWFQDPQFTEPTPMTWTDEGRVFGHIATWGTCHIGHQSACVNPPRSQTDYAYFTTGTIQCDDGCSIPVGTLTLGTGHAGLGLGARATAEHYDHTGTGAADVAIGEDEFGIWVAGAQRPGLTDEQVRVARASSASGDWRKIGGNLELVAVLQVNVPGFPVARVASGEQVALVAAAAPAEIDPMDRLRLDLDARLERIELVLGILDDPVLADMIAAMTEPMPEVYATGLSGYAFKYISQDERDTAAKSGAAMPGGRFPIRNANELSAAIHLYGQASDKAAVKAHIIKRARALGLTDKLPDDWSK